jgi:hypothetical protein
MEVRFIRPIGMRLMMLVERDDGATVRVTGVARGDELPHDLAHFVVESELALRDGFWGDIAAGRVFKGMEIVAGPPGVKHRRPFPRRPRRAPSPVIDAEVLVEIFVGIWNGQAEREYGSVRAFLDATYSPRSGSRADEIDEPTLARVCQRLTEASRAWSHLQPGAELRLHWPVAVARRP